MAQDKRIKELEVGLPAISPGVTADSPYWCREIDRLLGDGGERACGGDSETHDGAGQPPTLWCPRGAGCWWGLTKPPPPRRADPNATGCPVRSSVHARCRDVAAAALAAHWVDTAPRDCRSPRASDRGESGDHRTWAYESGVGVTFIHRPYLGPIRSTPVAGIRVDRPDQPPCDRCGGQVSRYNPAGRCYQCIARHGSPAEDVAVVRSTLQHPSRTKGHTDDCECFTRRAPKLDSTRQPVRRSHGGIEYEIVVTCSVCDTPRQTRYGSYPAPQGERHDEVKNPQYVHDDAWVAPELRDRLRRTADADGYPVPT